MQVNFCFGCMEETNSAPCPRCGYNSLINQNQSYALQQGTILHGKYLIGKMLGQGGFGITYIGWDLALSRKVAIKEFFPSAYVSREGYVPEGSPENESCGCNPPGSSCSGNVP